MAPLPLSIVPGQESCEIMMLDCSSRSTGHRMSSRSSSQQHKQQDDSSTGNGSNNNNNFSKAMYFAKSIQRLDDYHRDQRERDDLIHALAFRSYHLPGNTCFQDWIQYFANNHPIFGMMCHHPLHPIRVPMRLLFLLGSVTCGLVITNVVWLAYVYSTEDSNGDGVPDEPVWTFHVGGGDTGAGWTNRTVTTATTYDNDEQAVEITKSMLILWTVGGGLHAIFDNTIWYMTACVCCLPGRSLECCAPLKCCGHYLAVIAIVIITAMASFIVVLRATLDAQQEEDQDHVNIGDLQSGGLLDDTLPLGHADASYYNFLLSYGTELLLALFLYWPIVASVLFSGVLGCCRLPLLGGWPHEIALERHEREQQQHQTGRSGGDSILRSTSNLDEVAGKSSRT